MEMECTASSAHAVSFRFFRRIWYFIIKDSRDIFMWWAHLIDLLRSAMILSTFFVCVWLEEIITQNDVLPLLSLFFQQYSSLIPLFRSKLKCAFDISILPPHHSIPFLLIISLFYQIFFIIRYCFALWFISFGFIDVVIRSHCELLAGTLV